MPKLDELVAPGRVALASMELQRGVAGDLASVPALAKAVEEAGLVPRLAALMAGARSAGVRVIHCNAGFRRDRAGTPMNIPMVRALLRNPDHLVIGSPEAEVIPALGPEHADVEIMRTHGMSPFAGTNLDPLLRAEGATTIIATGVSLNVGVIGMVIEAVNHGFDVVIPTDCVVGFPEEYGQQVLEHSLTLLAKLTTSAEILEVWRRAAEA